MSFFGIFNSDHSTFCNCRMSSNHFFHLPGRQAMSGNVHHIISAAHDEDVSVLIYISFIAGVVVTLVLTHVRIEEALMVSPYGWQTARR